MSDDRPPLSSATKTVLISCGVTFMVGVAAAVALFIACINGLNNLH